MGGRPPPEDVKRRVIAAICALYRHDRELLDVDANERSITHKLAEHLQRKFPGWHVDCEYNRGSNGTWNRWRNEDNQEVKSGWGHSMSTNFAESEVESAALAWLESLRWQVKHGPEIAPETLAAEHDVFDQVCSPHREAVCPNPL